MSTQNTRDTQSTEIGVFLPAANLAPGLACWIRKQKDKQQWKEMVKEIVDEEIINHAMDVGKEAEEIMSDATDISRAIKIFSTEGTKTFSPTYTPVKKSQRQPLPATRMSEQGIMTDGAIRA